MVATSSRLSGSHGHPIIIFQALSNQSAHEPHPASCKVSCSIRIGSAKLRCCKFFHANFYSPGAQFLGVNIISNFSNFRDLVQRSLIRMSQAQRAHQSLAGFDGHASFSASYEQSRLGNCRGMIKPQEPLLGAHFAHPIRLPYLESRVEPSCIMDIHLCQNAQTKPAT